jgi:hypothetical protein
MKQFPPLLDSNNNFCNDLNFSPDGSETIYNGMCSSPLGPLRTMIFDRGVGVIVKVGFSFTT